MRGKGFIADDLTNHAIEFIERRQRDPFFCYLPFNTPHSPMQVPDRFWEKFANFDPKMRARDPKQEEIPMTRAALAMTENLDWNVGRLLSRLDELKLRDNTIVIYFSDNGPNSWRWNGGMKGRKGSVDEGGVRAPFVIRWPGRIRPGTRVSHIAGAIDLLPTLADLSGIPRESGQAARREEREAPPARRRGQLARPDDLLARRPADQRADRPISSRLQGPALRHGRGPDAGSRCRRRKIRRWRRACGRPSRSGARRCSRWSAPDDRPYPVGYATSTILPAGHGARRGRGRTEQSASRIARTSRTGRPRQGG